MRDFCDIFRKLALGNPEQFKEAIFSLEADQKEMKEHIKNCRTCHGTIQRMGLGDKSFVGALLNTNIE